MKKLRVTVDGKSYEVLVETFDEPRSSGSPAPSLPSASPGIVAPPVSTPAPAAPSAAAAGSGSVASPLAGRVVSIDCIVGQKVENGTQLVTIEAMKMNTYVHAHAAGSVTAIHVKAGDAVEEGQALLVIQ